LQPLPKHYDAGDASIVFVKDRMNVLTDYEHTDDGTILSFPTNSDQPFFDLKVKDNTLKKELAEIAKADFIAFDERFFDLIGPRTKLEPMFNL